MMNHEPITQITKSTFGSYHMGKVPFHQKIWEKPHIPYVRMTIYLVSKLFLE